MSVSQGKLTLANLMISTVFTNTTALKKVNFGVSVANGELWMTGVLLAGFYQSGILSLDSDIYMISAHLHQFDLITSRSM